MTGGRKPSEGQTGEQADKAAAERARYQALPKERRQAIVQNRDRQAQQAADARRHERDKPKRLAKQRDWVRKTWEEQAPKRKARAAAALLPKKPCANCGSKVNVEAHHADHGKPTDVTWLCAKCHGRQTAREQAA